MCSYLMDIASIKVGLTIRYHRFTLMLVAKNTNFMSDRPCDVCLGNYK